MALDARATLTRTHLFLLPQDDLDSVHRDDEVDLPLLNVLHFEFILKGRKPEKESASAGMHGR